MLSAEYITEFYKKYRGNLDKETKITNNFLNAESQKDWVLKLQEKFEVTRELYIENEGLLNTYVRPFIEGRQNLTLEIADTFLNEIKQLDKDGYYDNAVMYDMCEILAHFYRENNSTEKYISVINLLGKYCDSVYSSEDGKKAIKCFETICSYSDKYYEIEDFETRKRVLYAFYNRTIVKQNFNLAEIDELRRDCDEAIAFYNNPKVRELDGKDFDFDELIKELKYDVFGGYVLGKDKDEIDKSVVLETKGILQEYYDEALKENPNPYEMLDEIYCDYNRCCFFLDEISFEDFIEDYKKYCDYVLEHDKVDYEDESYVDSRLFQVITRHLPNIIDCLNRYGNDYSNSQKLKKECINEYVRLVRNLPRMSKSSFVNDVICRTLFNFMELVVNGEVDFNTLLNIVTSRDEITMVHSRMVSQIACRLLDAIFDEKPELLIGTLDCKNIVDVLENEEKIRNYISVASLIFDIGKIEMADIITKQTRQLTKWELNCIFDHPQAGVELIKKIPYFNQYHDVILGHHKSYDGKMGYPSNFDNTESPYRFLIEIIHIADCLDAATDFIGRSYKKIKTFSDCLQEFIMSKGTVYSPQIIELIEMDISLQKDLSDIVSENRIRTYYETYGIVMSNEEVKESTDDWHSLLNKEQDEKERLINILFESSKENHDFVQALVKRSLLTIYIDLYNGEYRVFSRGSHKLFPNLLDGKYQDFLRIELLPTFKADEREYLRYKFTLPELTHALVGTTGNYEFELQMKIENQYHWVRMQCLKMSEENKIPTSMAMIFTDIDEIHKKNEQMEVALKEAYQTALEANNSKSNFLSNMSHDIRTPMNAIINIAKLMKLELNNPELLENHLNKILESSEVLLGIVNDVLDMSKIESGKTVLTKEVVELGTIIDKIETVIRPQASQKNQTFTIIVNNIEQEKIITDGTRLYQVLSNLLVNAVKYTNDNGNISLSITGLKERTKNYECIEFVVKDNGIGMTQEYLKKIYEPFTRQENSMTNKVQGTGLGMAIAKNIIDLMGGTIEIDSEVNKGTTITVILEFPYSEIEKSILEDKKTVLLYHDESLRESVEKAYAAHNIPISSFNKENELLERFINHDEYNLVLIEPNISKEYFNATMQRIKKASLNKFISIAITSNTKIELLESVDGYIELPFFFTTLENKVKEIENIDKHAENSNESILKGMHFLCAEDNELNAEVLTLLLEADEATCTIYDNGQKLVDAFNRSKEGDFDMILMDVQMPIMNGYEATRAIRSSDHPLAKSVPIIAMTANAFSEDIQNALSSGMNAHLAKPLDMKKLEVIVKSLKEK